MPYLLDDETTIYLWLHGGFVRVLLIQVLYLVLCSAFAALFFSAQLPPFFSTPSPLRRPRAGENLLFQAEYK